MTPTTANPSLVILAAQVQQNDTKKDTKKVPWEFGRFLKTVNFFEAFRPGFLKKKAAGTVQVKPGDLVWSRDHPDVEWGPLDDVVMGGASRSDLQPGVKFDGTWSGSVTTANNGGFAGIRTKLFSPKKDASACRGFLLKVKGDGSRFKFIARDDEDWNGIAWSTSFDTVKGKEVAVKIPWSKLKATRFARTILDKNFDKSSVTGIQISLSKFEYDGGLNPKFTEGPFKLDIEKVEFF
jgi:hypothetical protein